MASQSAIVVSSADFVRRFGAWQDRASTDPIFVTHHGRRRHVMLSMPAYEAMLAAAEGGTTPDGDRLKLETLVAQLDACFIALDAELTVTSMNPAAVAFFGVAQAAIVGRPLGDELPELERSVVRAHLGRTLASGEVAAFEMPAISHPGEWLRCSVFPFGSGVACLLRNVTSEHNAHAVDQWKSALTEAMMAAGGIGLGMLSLRGTFSFVGTQLAEFAGFSPQALEQVRLTDILPLSRRVEAASHVESVLNGREARGFDTALLVNKGGERPVRIGLAPLRGDYAIDGAMVVVTVIH
ncbi:PAS domain-containing protein [Sphingomonas jatrophae]|uniref:PAS domain-containing protein n=1 Tax=Sphingomonas jatrophae TaxID=1166337 RepID=A0A1I6JJC0_9SPHN|nr:PAS domain-containing protein [Sphingomonas jatrophae]SFR79116.1 PAS domain-containing protein [Sphingomonas jatrophae]